MFKLVTGKEAVEHIHSGDTVCVGGNLNLLEPETILYELEQSFLRSGKPRDLTLLFPVFLGSMEGRGLDYFAHEGFVKKMAGGSYAAMLPNRKMNELILQNKVAAYNIPMGQFYKLLEATGAQQPGLLTSVGLHTQIDPRVRGGKLNECTTEDIVKIVEIDGKEYLFFPSPKINVSIIRGTSVDEKGNISLENEPTDQGIYDTALAAKASGGIVIAQVRRKIQGGSVHPRLVMVPGRLVDYVVIDERDEDVVSHYPQCTVGGIRQPIELKEPLPLDHKKIILRRLLMEIRKGDLVNLGFGIPAGLPSVVVEEGVLGDFTFSIEHGSVGGVPGWTGVFGVAQNPEALLTSIDVFDMYTAGLLNVTCLGLGEVDPRGNVNNHKFGRIISGTGGFNEIVHRTPKILFGGTFTSGGIKTEVVDGKLHILQEGKHKKFVPKIEGVTMNADEIRRHGQKVVFVTERAVFHVGKKDLVLDEYAPGIDVQKDILDQMDFPVTVSPSLKCMDARIFQAQPMGYKLLEN